MPELPEVETMRRGILGIVGAKIRKAERTACTKRPISIKPRIDHLNRRVANRTVKSVDRLGKRVVIRLDSDDRIILEPRMSGLVLLADPPTTDHLRFRLSLTNSKVREVLFWDQRGLGMVTLMSPDEYQQKIDGGTLGPDALDVDLDQFVERFKSSRREIKVALLDQAAIAGVGNLYASELLHLSGIHPQARCHRIKRPQWKAMFEAMVLILERAIEKEGSTLSDGTYRNALNQDGSFQNEHLVYDRADQNCTFCRRTKIKRIVQSQRSTFFCPKCQTKTGNRA